MIASALLAAAGVRLVWGSSDPFERGAVCHPGDLDGLLVRPLIRGCTDVDHAGHAVELTDGAVCALALHLTEPRKWGPPTWARAYRQKFLRDEGAWTAALLDEPVVFVGAECAIWHDGEWWLTRFWVEPIGNGRAVDLDGIDFELVREEIARMEAEG